MTQQVNFLKSVPKPKTQLPPELIMLVVTGVFVLLVLGSMMLWMYQWSVNSQLTSVQQTNQDASAAYQKLAAQYPLLASDTPLVTTVMNLEKALHDKEAYFAQLTHATIRKPFSTYLNAIAQAVPDGLWLTIININEDSGNLSLQGEAMNPSLISLFLSALEQIPPFAGETFELFAVKQKSNTLGLHQFEVANKQLLNDALTAEKKKGDANDDKK